MMIVTTDKNVFLFSLINLTYPKLNFHTKIRHKTITPSTKGILNNKFSISATIVLLNHSDTRLLPLLY